MTEQWQELKETITEMRDNEGTGTQQDVCKFLVGYMEVLEKQMQQPCEDCISREEMLSLQTEYAEKMGATTFWKLRDDIRGLPSVKPTNEDISEAYIKGYDYGVKDWFKSKTQPCEDVVSRQAVDKLSRDLVHVTRDKADFLCNFWEGLNALPSVTPQRPRWIPVGEKLPEANRAVLTYIDIGATKTYCLAYWNDAYKAWEEWMGYCLIEKDRDYKVIAWMPLPEPYKAESEDAE